jgi:hypothetical protein
MKITINDPHAVGESAGSKKPDFMLSNKVCAQNIFEILLLFDGCFFFNTCEYIALYVIICINLSLHNNHTVVTNHSTKNLYSEEICLITLFVFKSREKYFLGAGSSWLYPFNQDSRVLQVHAIVEYEAVEAAEKAVSYSSHMK